MPGMPIFQDSPSQLKGQIYALNNTTSAIEPLMIDDTTGSLTVGGTVGLATGAEVDLATGAEVGLVTGTEVGLTTGTEVGLASGALVGLSAGSNLIGKVENQLVFTNVDSFGGATPLTSTTVGATATVEADQQDVSLESSYNWYIQNTGTTSSDQDITLKVEISPDGTNWLEDTGTTISVPYNNTAKMITVTNFLQYVRFVITGGAAETTVISCFQAQH